MPAPSTATPEQLAQMLASASKLAVAEGVPNERPEKKRRKNKAKEKEAKDTKAKEAQPLEANAVQPLESKAKPLEKDTKAKETKEASKEPREKANPVYVPREEEERKLPPPPPPPPAPKESAWVRHEIEGVGGRDCASLPRRKRMRSEEKSADQRQPSKTPMVRRLNASQRRPDARRSVSPRRPKRRQVSPSTTRPRIVLSPASDQEAIDYISLAIREKWISRKTYTSQMENDAAQIAELKGTISRLTDEVDDMRQKNEQILTSSNLESKIHAFVRERNIASFDCIELAFDEIRDSFKGIYLSSIKDALLENLRRQTRGYVVSQMKQFLDDNQPQDAEEEAEKKAEVEGDMEEEEEDVEVVVALMPEKSLTIYKLDDNKTSLFKENTKILNFYRHIEKSLHLQLDFVVEGFSEEIQPKTRFSNLLQSLQSPIKITAVRHTNLRVEDAAAVNESAAAVNESAAAVNESAAVEAVAEQSAAIEVKTQHLTGAVAEESGDYEDDNLLASDSSSDE